MSTYLIAFVISNFEGHEENNVGIYASSQLMNKTEYGLTTGQKIVKALSDYLNLDYFKYMEKLDFVSIPDFDAGKIDYLAQMIWAMENYGLVTYRDTRLLYDELHSSTKSKQKVCAVKTC